MCLYPRELNGSEISRYLKVTHRSVHKAMRSLVDEGVVDFDSHGNSIGYKLNREKWIVKKMLLPLFKSEKVFLETVIEKIRKEIEGSPFKKNILSVVLFGSVHKKEDKNSSDFDIFVLIDREENISSIEDEIIKIGTNISKIYGVTLGPYLKSLASFKKDKALSVIKSIMASNHLIYGKELARV
jgi:predicted nucleotidyltransferase